MKISEAIRRIINNLIYDPEYNAEPSENEPESDIAELDNDDFKRQQAEIDIEHYQEQLEQFYALQDTINAEIEAIRATRQKLKQLESLHDNPVAYTELYASIDRRDYSEKREATLQRQLITVSNNIYTAKKRIAKAERIAAGK